MQRRSISDPLPRNLLIGPLVAALLALFAGAPPARALEAGGGTLLLRDLVRADVLRDLTFTGRVVSGEEAVAIGLATRLDPAPHAAALAAAREIAARNPHAIRAAKRLMNRADDAFAAAQLLAESVEQKAILGSPNQREAVRANLEKRVPVFQDA